MHENVLHKLGNTGLAKSSLNFFMELFVAQYSVEAGYCYQQLMLISLP